jgi:hypothetical protein
MNFKPLPSPNGTNYAGLYIPASWPWQGPQYAMDAMPRNLRRQDAAPSQHSSVQREIAQGAAYGRRFAEQLLAPRNPKLAFDQTPQREQDLQVDLDPMCVERALGVLASKLSPDDYRQARALLKGSGETDKPSTGPMTHQGSSAWGNLADRAAIQARDARRRSKAAEDGIGGGIGSLLGGLIGSAAGPLGAVVGSQIGGGLGESAEKGLTHMITDPAQAAPNAHSETDDAMPSSSSNRFENKATSSANHTDADADTRWMTPTADSARYAMPHASDSLPRSAQGYFSSDRTAYLDAQKATRLANDKRRRIGRLAQDSKQADFDKRFPEVARIKIL